MPLDEAIEQGRFDASDLTPANLAALHDEHAREALAVLADGDVVASARRANVDPATGKRPRTAKLRDALPARLTATLEPHRHRFELLMDVYAEAFGDDAAAAFRKAIVAWHAGIEVVRDDASRADRVNSSRNADCDEVESRRCASLAYPEDGTPFVSSHRP